MGDSEWTKGSSTASGQMLKKELFKEDTVLSVDCLWVGWGVSVEAWQGKLSKANRSVLRSP